MEHSHDLSLPSWGPYNKNYLGCSHVADKERGLRFEVRLFPGFFRRSAVNPKTIVDGGVKMMASSPDLSHFVYRYELEWKDRVYCDADFSSEGENCCIECNFVNDTDEPQVLNMNMFFSMELPSVYGKTIHPCRPVLSEHAVYIDAVDYREIVSDCRMGLDGLYLGEGRYSGFAGGSGISSAFFGSEGHKLSYNFAPKNACELGVRYMAKEDTPVTLTLGGVKIEAVLPKTNGVGIHYINIKEGSYSSLTLEAHGKRFDLDGFLLGRRIADTRFEKIVPDFKPVENIGKRCISLDYGFIGRKYEISWDSDDYALRDFYGDNAPEVLTNSLHNHVSSTFWGTGEGFSKNLFLKPVFLDPNESKKIKVNIRVSDAADAGKSADVLSGEHALAEPSGNSAGDKYRFSQKILSAVTLTNVVYPIYCRREYIRHNTPGRLWDSLYTWDSGMIGVGLSAISPKRAEESLLAYLTPIGDRHSPFIFHGSVVPTQIFQLEEIWNKTRDVEFLRRVYPFIRQYYRFFADLRYDGEQMKSGLIKMWHIFYNSGGWDDYPAQVYMHSKGMSGTTSPVISSAITALCAKILKKFAAYLGEESDIAGYGDDIAFFSEALQKYAWDEESGYFGYVCHDGEGNPTGIMRNADGVNFNMGLDGVYPYIAGITSGEQSDIQFSHIEKDMMTKYGMSVVDTGAPYYSKSGYWNGTIWMPHQWIVWKSLLDHGKTELAKKIALGAIEVFDTEACRTYNSYENFMVQNGRGAGFHQFSGLTSPVLDFYRAYFVPGSISGGFECITLEYSASESFDRIDALLSVGGEAPAIIACLAEGRDYEFTLDGKKAEAEKIFDGTYVIKNIGMGKVFFSARPLSEK